MAGPVGAPDTAAPGWVVPPPPWPAWPDSVRPPEPPVPSPLRPSPLRPPSDQIPADGTAHGARHGALARADPARPLSPQDLDRSWRLDFHHPRGVVPLAVRLLDHLVEGSQSAARETRSGHGFTARLVGSHVYYGRPDGVPPGRAATPVPPAELHRYGAAFPAEWAADAARLDAALIRLEAVPRDDLARAGTAAIAGYLRQALAAHREAWRVHFATMYRLLAVHGFVLAELRDLGLDDVTAAGLLQGVDNAVLAVDQELRELAALARDHGVAGHFELPIADLGRRLGREPRAAGWWAAFEEFLARHGNRGEAGAEISTPGWNEDPAAVLALVRRELIEHSAAPARPDIAEVAGRIRQGLAPGARPRFETAYRLARQANFAWWNEEHNAVIDLRAHLPVRRAALAASAALRLPRPDDALYLHLEELTGMLAGQAAWADLADVVGQRRDYVERWRTARSQLPVRLGTGEDDGDPVLREILGAGAGTVAQGDVVLAGLGVSPGRAEGRARVLTSVADLAELRRGEVLVCEATSPGWTPAFDRIAACVCDQGGMLTHAAIIAREYGVPAVCAVGGASTTIRTGDLLAVDGTTGEVRVLVATPR